MRRARVHLIALAAASCFVAASLAAAQPLRVMTYNIRYDEPRDGPHAWPLRREGVARLLLFHRPEVVGIQEALSHQLEWLRERLPGMTAVGVGRDDGAAKGELTAILYDSGRLEARRHGSFWLSETPERPGKGWDAAFPRIVTWAELAERATGRRFFAFATHFDHLGAVARRGSARLLQRRGAELAGDAPSVVIGDLNATSEDEPVRLLLEPGSPWRLLDAVSATGAAHHGPLRTFSGFDPRTGFAGGRIDHILVSPAFRVLASAVLTDHDERGYYSDHLPVLAELEIRGPGPATR